MQWEFHLNICTVQYFTPNDVSRFSYTHFLHPSVHFRKRRRQRAPNAASGTVATLTAGTPSVVTHSLHHVTAARTHLTAWTPSAHAHDKPHHQTSWSPVAAAMVVNSPTLYSLYSLYVHIHMK